MDRRLLNEIRHGEHVDGCGEALWNWSSPAGRRRWARRCRLLSEFLGDSRGRVLEIGCGTGLFTAEMARAGNTLAAIDVSHPLIAKAKKRITSAGVGFVVGNGYETPFMTGSFDAIVGISSLHHLDADAALREFLRILRPGGALLFTEPNMMNPQVALTKNVAFLKRRAGDSPDETAFFRWRMAGRLRGFGFVDVSIKPFDFLHPALPAPWLTAAEPIALLLEKIPLLREIAGSLIIQGRKKIEGP